MIWPGAPHVGRGEVEAEAERWRSADLPVVAIQSLLFGHPELALFDPATHPGLVEHLTRMTELSAALGAHVAVFGSPRNRIKGALSGGEADSRAAEFFGLLEPVLAREGVVLTLEPNAPQYGADYLTTYDDCVRLADLVGSPWIAPQIDTGCLRMVDADIPAAIRTRTPAHVHVSAPNLGPVPADVDHRAISAELNAAGYDGWVTLEMKRPEEPAEGTFERCVAYLVDQYGQIG
jgi:sugar phosphate isomerase/epimerase